VGTQEIEGVVIGSNDRGKLRPIELLTVKLEENLVELLVVSNSYPCSRRVNRIAVLGREIARSPRS
jgi:hypothetical protein